MINGVLTALVTPFKNSEIDFHSLEKLIQHQLDHGIEGFVVCGTTAESPTLSEDEQLQILDFVCNQVSGKVPVVFGSGSNSTAKTIALSQKAQTYPIDAFLVVVPYYNKPPQEGLILHFESVANSVEKPVILYNVPTRTITKIEPSTLVKLAEHPNIIGVKEASGDLELLSTLVSKLPKDFALLSGDDETSIEFCYLGGHGVISVCSHIAPQQMVQWIHRACDRDPKILQDFEPNKKWIRELYTAPNPIPVKSALTHKGIIESAEMRLPLIPMPSDLDAHMVQTMKNFEGLI
jgi:4-hydroxy-tetrahydrodipicolinate synthase